MIDIESLRAQYADEEAKFKHELLETDELLREIRGLQSEALAAMIHCHRVGARDRLEIAAKAYGAFVASELRLIENMTEFRHKLESLSADFIQLGHAEK
jgi:hypothetical protein